MIYDWENLVMFIFPTQTEIKKRKYNKENMGKYSIYRYIIIG